MRIPAVVSMFCRPRVINSKTEEVSGNNDVFVFVFNFAHCNNTTLGTGLIGSSIYAWS